MRQQTFPCRTHVDAALAALGDQVEGSELLETVLLVVAEV
jgi:hypothetical protein